MMISEVAGSFKQVSGTITQVNGDFTGSSVDVDIKTASITTDNDARDNHLRSGDFFDAANNPDIIFKSTSFEKTGDNSYIVKGNLTMHGITKSVELQTTYNGSITDGQGKKHAGFTATGSVNRTDFGLTWNKTLEAGGVLVSELVKLTLNIEAVPIFGPVRQFYHLTFHL